MKFYIVRVNNQDIKVKAYDRKDALRKAKRGKGRVVGVCFN